MILIDNFCCHRKKLRPEYKEFCDLVEVISEQMLQVQANLLLTFIVHDEDSQDWESHHVYYEGERGSPTVQMWSYFLRSNYILVLINQCQLAN